VQVANPDNALRPGMHLQVKFVFRNEKSGGEAVRQQPAAQ
jgi:hypothetical protein